MAGKTSLIRRLIGGLWRTLVLVYSLIFLVILIAVPVGIYLTFYQPEPPVPDNAVLVMEPQGTLAEQGPDFQQKLQGMLNSEDEPTVIHDLVAALDQAADDDRIKKVLLKLDELDGALPAQLQELTEAIDRFRESGKKVVAWSDSYDQTRYELASHADETLVDPLGQVMLTGYDGHHHFFKDALDTLGVTINVFRVGKYKSFVEPFTRNEMSEQARRADLAWMGSLWDTYKEVITADRDLEPEDIDHYIDDYADNLTEYDGDGARLAHEYDLVDGVVTLEALRDDLMEQYGEDADMGSFPQVDTAAYLADTGRSSSRNDDPESALAVVTVDGNIVDDDNVPGATSGDVTAELINSARQDDAVKGLLLRVNSPGGSVTAAETIRRAVADFKAAGKPVVVSMSGTAASGGYWVSMNADEIWALPSTITGSIGIFAIVPTFDKPLESLGIHTDGVGTTKLAGGARLDRPLSDDIKQIMQAQVEHGYHQFTHRVAKARHMDEDKLEDIAQGRVWSGHDAQKLDLIDELGGMQQAVEALAAKAKLDEQDYQLQWLQPPSDWQGMMQSALGQRVSASLLPDWLQSLAASPALRFLQTLSDPNGLYAHCFCQMPQARTLDD